MGHPTGKNQERMKISKGEVKINKAGLSGDRQACFLFSECK